MIARVALVVCAALGIARAQPDDEKADPTVPLAKRGTIILDAKTAWRTQVVLSPRIQPQIGALAVTGLDVVAKRAKTVAPVLGDAVEPPAKWPYDVDAPQTPSTLKPQAPADRRVATLYAATTFALTEKDQGYEVLELRLAFEDGVRVFLNGSEVVREALSVPTSVGLADRPHGPEAQTFYIPVGPGVLRLGPNTLAIESHPSGRKLAPSLGVELAARRDVGILRGPRISDIGPTSAKIVVDTDPNVAAELAWNIPGGSPATIKSLAGSHHVFALDALPAKSQIEYRVVAGGTSTPTRRFHTQAGAGDTIRIGVYGDVRGGHSIHRKLVQQMMGEGLDLVAVTGDMVLHGSDEADWQRFYVVTNDLVASVPYLPAVGNHDLGWDGNEDAARAAERLAMPAGPSDRPKDAYWYSTDIADVHLVFLDSNAYDRREQETWLTKDLADARAKKVRAIIAFTHDGPYSRGYHRGSEIARTRFVPILVGGKVDLLVSGHDHMYQRGEIGGLRYIVSGGGGASLYSVTCGVAGKPACKDDGMVVVERQHHYVTLTIERSGTIEACPRKPDGSPLERCVRFKR